MTRLPAFHELFPIERAVQPDDPTCVPDVYALPNPTRLTSMLNRCGPVLLSAPGVQGKTSFLLQLRMYLEGNPALGIVPVEVRCQGLEHCDRRSFGDCLKRSLGSDRGDHDFGMILESSRVIGANSQRNALTVLLIDSAMCHSEDVLEWLLYSIGLMGADFRSVALGRRVSALITEDCETSVLPRWRFSDYGFPRIVFRNFDLAETRVFCEKVERASGRAHAVRFQAMVPEQLHMETAGDKYFVPVVAKAAVEIAQQRAVGSKITTVSNDDLRTAAALFKTGERSEPRVVAVVERWIAQDVLGSRKLRDDVVNLVRHGASAWHSVSPDTQKVLFQKGVLELAPEPDGRVLTVRETIEHPDRSAEDRYQPREILKARLCRVLDLEVFGRLSPRQNRRGLPKLLEEEQEFLAQRDEFRKMYAGRFVAVHDGEVVDSDEDEFELGRRLMVGYPGEDILIRHVDQDQVPAEFSSPECGNHE